MGGRLYLSGVDPSTHEQMRRNRTLLRDGVEVFEASATVGEASLEAYRAAEAWLQDQH